jgi:predicted TIM-barrel fold metal-dependent hydrolase
MTLPKIISADDHALEPPDLWTSRMPRKLLDAAPRVERLPAGTKKVDSMGRISAIPGTEGPPADYWFFDDQYWCLTRQWAAAGFDRDDMDDTPVTYDDIRPGCFRQSDRLADMDINGIDASLCFPNYSRFAGQRFLDMQDREVALACVQAYNDWMVEEWCGTSEGRLIPLCIVPLWDARLAAAEVYRNAERGVRAACFTEMPENLGLPATRSGEWDPFYQACNETSSVITMHIGSGTVGFQTPGMSPTATLALQFVTCAGSMADYLTGGVLARFPNIKLYYAECQVGWIPYLLDRLDDCWMTYPFRRQGRPADELPSTFYRGRVYSCMFKDQVGTRLLDLIGEDQVMFECDYPHGDGTWPETPKRAEALVGGLAPEVQRKILRTNAIELFGLSLAP